MLSHACIPPAKYSGMSRSSDFPDQSPRPGKPSLSGALAFGLRVSRERVASLRTTGVRRSREDSRLFVLQSLPSWVWCLSQLLYSCGTSRCCLVRENSEGLYVSFELAKRTATSKRSTAERLADMVTSGACCESDPPLLLHSHDLKGHEAEFHRIAILLFKLVSASMTRDNHCMLRRIKYARRHNAWSSHTAAAFDE